MKLEAYCFMQLNKTLHVYDPVTEPALTTKQKEKKLPVTSFDNLSLPWNNAKEHYSHLINP